MLSKKVTAVLVLILMSSMLPMHVSYAETKWLAETVDSAGSVGRSTSLALDSNDNPHISYCDYTRGDLKYAWWTGSSWSNETVDSEVHIGLYTSLALDSNDNPHISYHDDAKGDLKYAWWTGSTWSIETVDEFYFGFGSTSLALDSNDNPHISYCDTTHMNLRYAYSDGSIWFKETVDSAYVGGFSSLVLDSNGYPHISYKDSVNHCLLYAKFGGSTWSIETVDSAGSVGWWPSLALDSNDNPHISYHDQTNMDLKYAKVVPPYQIWSIETVDSAGSVGWYTSLALDSNDNPHISYYDDTNVCLKYYHSDGSTSSIETVDSEVGWWSSLVLDSNGYPHISYYDQTNMDLKYATVPQLSVSVSPDSSSVAVDESTSFFASASGGTSPYSYQWYEGTSVMPGQTSANISISRSDAGSFSYSCKVTDFESRTTTSNTVSLTVNTPSPLSDNIALYIGAPVGVTGIVLTVAAITLWRRKRKGSQSKASPVLAAKTMPATINVLFLAANPDGSTPLDLNTELNAIEDVLDSCKFRDRFNLEQRFELKPGEIAKMLLKYDPHIVHFSGHGSEAGEIILQDANNEARPIGASAISNLFSVLKGNIRCVVLNACYSKRQAKLISKYIDCVIGMSKAIGDEAAIQFAEGFYRGLGFGKDLETAFKLGCAEIDLEGLDEKDTPKIIWKNDQPQKILFT